MVEQKVIKILSKYGNLDESQIKSKSSLDSLGIDSVAMVEIIFEIQEEFEITIPYNANQTSRESFDFSHVSSIISLVNKFTEVSGGKITG